MVKKIEPWFGFTEDKVFGMVMENKDFCKYLLEIIIPDLKIANKFENIVKPLFEEWTKNIFCNIELTKQRNELLPLLMNGQVSVNSDLSDD